MSNPETKSPDTSTITSDDSNPIVNTTTNSNQNQINDTNDDNPVNTTTTISSNAVAEGISTLLNSIIKDFDSKANDASRTQFKLSSSLDRLTTELDQLLEDAPLPFIMQHATKLSKVRKRVSSLNLLLRSVQHRLDNIDRMISTGSHDNKSNVGDSK